MAIMSNFDVRILEEIRKRGKNGITLGLLCGVLFPGKGAYGHDGRRTDRALQKLRKADLIHYCSPSIGWRPGKAPPEALSRR